MCQTLPPVHPGGVTVLQDFIQRTGVETRGWLLQQTDEREGGDEWGWGRLREEPEGGGAEGWEGSEQGWSFFSFFSFLPFLLLSLTFLFFLFFIHLLPEVRTAGHREDRD